VRHQRLILGAGLVGCLVILIVHLTISMTKSNLPLGSIFGLAVMHVYFAYYYFNRLAGREARLLYYLKAPGGSPVSVQDIVAFVISLLVLLLPEATNLSQ
jgi:hypothetical protein